jgi:polysaccharide pyruvyl transferase WcaK-like protein
MVREFVSACRLIAVRDDATASRLATELGTRPPVFGDFCLNERPLPELQAARLAERPMPAVNASQLPARWSAAQPAYEDALVRVAHYLARTTAPAGGIRIFTTGTAEDAIVAWRVYSRLQDCGAELHLPHDLAHLLALLRASSVVVASRLHGAILALAQDVPVVGYSPAPKLRNFLSTLGLAHYCFAPGADPDLERWFADASYSRFCAEQRHALARARVWPARARVRDALAALAREAACG